MALPNLGAADLNMIYLGLSEAACHVLLQQIVSASPAACVCCCMLTSALQELVSSEPGAMAVAAANRNMMYLDLGEAGHRSEQEGACCVLSPA